MINFNSIKVQLEPAAGGDVSRVASFQFHKGTIRTLHDSVDDSVVLAFQFHKGTIRTGNFIPVAMKKEPISIP